MQKEIKQSQGNYITIGNYHLYTQQLLGQGTTGKVYKGQNCSSRTPVAIKHIDLKTINDDATKTLLQNQIKALKMITHKNVIKLIQVVEVTSNLYIVTELIEGGTLCQKLADKTILSQRQALTIFRDILAGCAAIAEANIIHRDLKPSNIMLSNLTPKIIDFGFCEVIMGGGIVRAFNVGSPAYMAPEALLKTLYSEKSDSWSLGIILYEMLHGSTPDRGEDIKVFLQKVKTTPNFIKNSLKVDLSSNVREMLQKSLSYKPQERMSISSLKYLTDVYFLQTKDRVITQNQAQPQILNQVPFMNQFVSGKTNVDVRSSLRQSTKRTQVEIVKDKNSSGLMFTQLPGKKMKENTVKVADENSINNKSQFMYALQRIPKYHITGLQYFIPQETKALNYKYNKKAQPTSGSINFAEFVNKPLMNMEQNRNSRIAAKEITVIDESKVSQRFKMGVGCGIDPSRQIMAKRGSLQPVYRQVTVRYL